MLLYCGIFVWFHNISLFVSFNNPQLLRFFFLILTDFCYNREKRGGEIMFKQEHCFSWSLCPCPLSRLSVFFVVEACCSWPAHCLSLLRACVIGHFSESGRLEPQHWGPDLDVPVLQPWKSKNPSFSLLLELLLCFEGSSSLDYPLVLCCWVTLYSFSLDTLTLLIGCSSLH